MIGRYCELRGEKEISDLVEGLDFREPRFRREVFLRFYEFHLKWKAHPGAVYYMMPHLAEEMNLDLEGRLWMAFLNGCCQNIVSTYLILEKFPTLQSFDIKKFSSWFRENYELFGWDTDRRYVKNKFEELILNYKKITKGSSTDFFNNITKSTNEGQNFKRVWKEVINKFPYFGRLATFSYLEYLRIVGLELDCNDLFLEDIDGSKSHRNGLCKVLGRDDLDWHAKLNPQFTGYTNEQISWLKSEGQILLEEAKVRFFGRDFYKDVSYFTLESTLCCYKSWHRQNRRYPNVYNDMFYERIKLSETKWKRELKTFWTAREKYLDENLRLECIANDPGLSKEKQNHYLKTGEVIMMDLEWDCFKNNFNK